MNKEKTHRTKTLARYKENETNHRMIQSDHSSKLDIFDLSKLKEYPLKILKIVKSESNKKLLQFRSISENDLFSDNNKYVLIGDANRTSISKEFIVTNPTELYEAIKIYIIKALTRRCEPLGYFLVGLDKILQLRPYKRMLKNIEPQEILF